MTMPVSPGGLNGDVDLQSTTVNDASASDALHAAADVELMRTGIRFRFRDAGLERLYRDEVRGQARRLNRLTLAIIVLVVDLFILPEHKLAPEILTLSAVLRFAVLTPACLVFVLLDWRGKLGRAYDSALSLMAILPTLIIALIIVRTTSAAALPNIQSSPLIQLVIITSRLDIRHAAIVNLASWLAYGAAIQFCPAVPPSFLSSMSLTAAAIALGAFAFAVRVDLRERQVFLLGLQNERRRAQLARQNSVLTTLTHVDALTGLGNRRYFDERLEASWEDACTQRIPLSVVIFDIDHFKKFNDSLGHQAGDACLRVVGRAIAQCVRTAVDTTCRYGGEEFAIILPGAPHAVACTIAARVNAAVMACAIAHPAAGPPGCVTVSLGVATIIPGPGNRAAALVEAADRCLYAAKRNGRNQLASADLTQQTPAELP